MTDKNNVKIIIYTVIYYGIEILWGWGLNYHIFIALKKYLKSAQTKDFWLSAFSLWFAGSLVNRPMVRHYGNHNSFQGRMLT